jgi:heptosyltransferase-3
MKVAIFITARIGDSVMITSQINCITAISKTIKVDVFCLRKRRLIFKEISQIRRIITTNKQLAKIQLYIRAFYDRYDIAFCYPEEASLLRFSSSISNVTYTFASPLNADIKDKKIRYISKPTDHSIKELLKLSMLTKAAGFECNEYKPIFYLSEPELSIAKKIISNTTVSGSTPSNIITIHARSFYTKSHRNWPLQHFTVLCNMISSSNPDTLFIFTGSPDDSSYVSTITKDAFFRFYNACGKNLRISAALVKSSHIYIGVDTGMTHIAGCLNIPMVGLYHCLYPQSIYGSNNLPTDRSISLDDLVSKCNNSSEMSAITPKMVFSRIQDLLK